MLKGDNMANTSKRGFASMDASKQREIASKGGKAAHAKGTAHEFTSDEARVAGRKGGEAVSRDRAHMSAIGREGGHSRGARARASQTAGSSANDSTRSAGQGLSTVRSAPTEAPLTPEIVRPPQPATRRARASAHHSAPPIATELAQRASIRRHAERESVLRTRRDLKSPVVSSVARNPLRSG